MHEFTFSKDVPGNWVKGEKVGVELCDDGSVVTSDGATFKNPLELLKLGEFKDSDVALQVFKTGFKAQAVALWQELNEMGAELGTYEECIDMRDFVLDLFLEGN